LEASHREWEFALYLKVYRRVKISHQRLGCAIGGRGKQLERAAAVGLRATSTGWNGGSDATALVGHDLER